MCLAITTDNISETEATTTKAQGPAGQDGKSILTGNGAPASSLGNVGDVYLDLTSLNLYKKTSAGWGTPVANIKGATGASGSNGTNGTNGTNGVSITDVEIDSNGHLIVTLSDGNEIDAGSVRELGSTHKVTFESNQGSSVSSMNNVPNGTTITAPLEPIKLGYIFLGWYTSDGAKWSFDKDLVTKDITLYAHWSQFKVENGVLTQCTATGNVEIPYAVEGQVITSISNTAFAGVKTQIYSVIIPNSVTSIEAETFKGCTALGEVVLSESLMELSDSLFSGCSHLDSIYIPARVKDIG